MSNPWFRMYAEFLHDPKVQTMSEEYRWRLVGIFCMRCNGDVTLQDKYVTFSLRISDAEWQLTKAEFIANGFIDSDNNVLNWNKRQFVSDSSAPRVAKHRALHRNVTVTPCNVTVTPPDTEQIQIQNRTDTEQSKSKDMSPPTASTRKTGTRLPEDWKLPKPWGEWALQEKPHLLADDVRVMADGFKDWALSNANRAIGKKADWLAAWRNWVRNQRDSPKKVNGNSVQESRLNTARQIMGGLNGNDRTVIEINPVGSDSGDRARIPETFDGIRQSAIG